MPWLLPLSSTQRAFTFACLLCLLSACARHTLQIQNRNVHKENQPAVRLETIETFTNDRSWAIDSAEDYAKLDYRDNELAAHYFDGMRDKILLRKEVQWDCSKLTQLALSYQLQASKPLAVSIALRDPKGAWFETDKQTINPNNNNYGIVNFHLTFENQEQWLKKRHNIRRLHICLYHQEDATIIIDEITGDSQPWTTHAIQGLGSTQLISEHDIIQQGELIRITGDIQLSQLTDREQRKNLGATLNIKTPHGTSLSLPAFLTPMSTDQQTTYRIEGRICPQHSGTYTAQLSFTDYHGSHTFDQLAFTVQPSSITPAPIVIKNNRFTQNGKDWFARGMNIAWSGDYEPYFKQCSEAGINLVRVWVAPWNHPLQLGNSADRIFSDKHAAEIDQMFALAQEYNLRVQFVLSYHGLISHDWANNVANQKRGGSCLRPEEFWINPQAKNQHKEYLHYCLARWGQHPQLFAWELINEANLTKRYRDEDIATWHREMAQWIHSLEARGSRHTPIITSLSHSANDLGLNQVHELDIIQGHYYGMRPDKAIDQLSYLLKGPTVLAESGRHWRTQHDLRDHYADYWIHNCLLSICHGHSGTPMPWWWDIHLEPHDLFTRYKFINAIIDQLPKGWYTWQYQRAHRHNNVVVDSRHDRDGCLALVSWPTWLRSRDEISLANIPAIELSGINDGAWMIRLYNVANGSLIGEEKLGVIGNRINIALPDIQQPCFIIATRQNVGKSTVK